MPKQDATAKRTDIPFEYRQNPIRAQEIYKVYTLNKSTLYKAHFNIAAKLLIDHINNDLSQKERDEIDVEAKHSLVARGKHGEIHLNKMKCANFVAHGINSGKFYLTPIMAMNKVLRILERDAGKTCPEVAKLAKANTTRLKVVKKESDE